MTILIVCIISVPVLCCIWEDRHCNLISKDGQ